MCNPYICHKREHFPARLCSQSSFSSCTVVSMKCNNRLTHTLSLTDIVSVMQIHMMSAKLLLMLAEMKCQRWESRRKCFIKYQHYLI